MKKILVIGIKGMAGHVIFSSLQMMGDYEVYGIARNIEPSKTIFNLDITDTDALHKIMNNQFDIIINCIGILNNDAEENPHKAIWFNSYFPHFLEAATKNTNTKIISISTDCVFSGAKGNYNEEDFKDGAGFYAVSKSLGEINNTKDLTIRTSIIGPELNQNGIGLFHWFMQQESKTKGYSKAFWSGITTIELANVIDKAIKQDISGLITIAGNPKIDKYNLLLLFNKIFRNNTIEITENPNYVVDKSMYSLRQDFDYTVPTYEFMIIEMKKWIESKVYSYNYL